MKTQRDNVKFNKQARCWRPFYNRGDVPLRPPLERLSPLHDFMTRAPFEGSIIKPLMGTERYVTKDPF